MHNNWTSSSFYIVINKEVTNLNTCYFFSFMASYFKTIQLYTILYLLIHCFFHTINSQKTLLNIRL